MRVYPVILGCKLNQAEKSLFPLPVSFVSEEEAEAVWVHTCAITKEAERKSRKAIARAKRSGKKLLVSGCLLSLNGKQDFGKNVLKLSHQENPFRQASERILLEEAKVRAFVKVQDGCFRRCSFCVVPKTRPKLFSRPVNEILKEVDLLVQNGTKEVVLTGASLGLYGLPYEKKEEALPRLLFRIAERFPNIRIRLSSFDPRDWSGSLFLAFKEIPNLAPHLHLTLQSGDDAILQAMRRGYTVENFLAICDKLRSLDASFAITTDILVGFPGETPSAFENTLKTMKKARFSRCHIFPYSPRPGTSAEKDTVSRKEKKERVKEALALAQELMEAFSLRFQGKEEEVLVEGVRDGMPCGYTRHYLYVFLEGCAPEGAFVKAKLLKFLSRHPKLKTGGFYASVCAHKS